MNKDEILKALQEVDGGAVITTERGDTVVQRKGDEYRMKTALGYFIYSAEELAETLSEWEEEIYLIQ